MKVKSILVSQPQPNESSPYHDLGKRNKIKVDFHSFIQIEGVDARDVRQQKIDFSKFTAVVFTSRNVIDHYFRLAEEMRFQVPDDMKYFCQSEAIAFYLQKYIVFRKRKTYIGERDIQDLAPYIKKFKDEKYLLPSSDVLNPEVPKFLDEMGVDWERGILCRTVSSDLSDLDDVKYDILVFFTPSGIKSLFENFPKFVQGDTRIAVYGKTTVQAANELGLRIDIEVPTPETPSMAMALEKYVTEANKK
ncbi:MAG: uroporphyrinogen-III synthase [Weeksellaceae bacterium]